MNKLVHIKTDFPCVFLLNGTFTEQADSFNYNTANPIYVTTLPLEAHLLSYTVKIAGSKPLYNENLCSVFCDGDHMYIKLAKRSSYIYSSVKHNTATTATAEEFFNRIKKGQLQGARALLSSELSNSVDDASLQAFFDGYTAIIKNEYSKNPHSNEFYLIDNLGNGTKFVFSLKDNLIDDITEKPN